MTILETVKYLFVMYGQEAAQDYIDNLTEEEQSILAEEIERQLNAKFYMHDRVYDPARMDQFLYN